MFADNKQITTGLKRGDLVIYQKLYFQYHGRLVMFACKFTGDLEVARDIVQDAFLNLWEKSDYLYITSSPKSYLFQAVKNRALNYNRHLHVKQSAKDELIGRIDQAERSVYVNVKDPFHSLLELELDEKIGSTIDSMPEKCREVFQMSRHDHLKNKEIAVQMGISEKMVEKYISKAIRILRSELSEYVSILLLLLFGAI